MCMSQKAAKISQSRQCAHGAVTEQHLMAFDYLFHVPFSLLKENDGFVQILYFGVDLLYIRAILLHGFLNDGSFMRRSDMVGACKSQHVQTGRRATPGLALFFVWT